MNLILVLNDGETYTSLSGCFVVEVDGEGQVEETTLKDSKDEATQHHTQFRSRVYSYGR